MAIECLSSQPAVIPSEELHVDGKKCERFCRFVEEYADEPARRAIDDPELFKRLLKTLYYSHRSAFVHAGKEASVGVSAADNLDKPYFKHYDDDGKELLTPGLRWSASVVHGALMGFLTTFPPAAEHADTDLFGAMAMERAIVKVKIKRAITRGELVRESDIESS